MGAGKQCMHACTCERASSLYTQCMHTLCVMVMWVYMDGHGCALAWHVRMYMRVCLEYLCMTHVYDMRVQECMCVHECE
jgi:hypothetical protein